MVINTLTLAISIPLSLHEITIPPFESAPLGGTETDPVNNNGGFTFYLDHLNPKVMHVLHWIELVFLSISIWKAASGIVSSFLLSATFLIYLPDLESKLRFERTAFEGVRGYNVVSYYTTWKYGCRILRLNSLEQTILTLTLLLRSTAHQPCRSPLLKCMVLVIPVVGFHYDFWVVILPQVAVPVMIYEPLLVKELFEETEPKRDNNGYDDFTPQKSPKKKSSFNFFGRSSGSSSCSSKK